MGGPWVFDNLIALCDFHADDFMERRLSANLQAVQAKTYGTDSEQRRVRSIRRQQIR